MQRRLHNWVAIIAVAVLGLLAGLQKWIAASRPALSEFSASREFFVTNAADHGPGSLREAIYGADTADGRARIVFRVPRVELSSPLPPLVNPSGTVLEASAEGIELEARGVGPGPVLDVNCADSVLRGVRIVNAPELGILVRSAGFHLLDAWISRCDVALQVAEGAKDLLVEGTRFERNRIGVQVGPAVSGFVLRKNQFEGQRDAGVWAVAGSFAPQSRPALVVKDNLFDGNRLGAVVVNVASLIEGNEFRTSGEAAVFLIGSGARVRGNRIRSGAGAGIFADRTQGAVIEGNELDHNRTIGVLVRYSGDALVQRNRAYANGYGMAFVLGQAANPSLAAENILLSQVLDGIILIGDSPVLRRNQLRGNRQAGLRILDFFPGANERVESAPFLDNNSLDGNGLDKPVGGEYRAEARSRPK